MVLLVFFVACAESVDSAFNFCQRLGFLDAAESGLLSLVDGFVLDDLVFGVLLFNFVQELVVFAGDQDQVGSVVESSCRPPRPVDLVVESEGFVEMHHQPHVGDVHAPGAHVRAD